MFDVRWFLFTLCAHVAAVENMNSEVPYVVSNPPQGLENHSRGFIGDFFEVYSPPIRSRYSEVVWRALDPVLLPADVRARFDSSVMAITGFEVDVVRRSADGDSSV